MSCGLGAVILVLMLVKHDVEHVSDESERLTADLERLKKTGRGAQRAGRGRPQGQGGDSG